MTSYLVATIPFSGDSVFGDDKLAKPLSYSDQSPCDKNVPMKEQELVLKTTANYKLFRCTERAKNSIENHNHYRDNSGKNQC